MFTVMKFSNFDRLSNLFEQLVCMEIEVQVKQMEKCQIKI